MSEHTPMSEVRFELPTETVSDLMAVLGNFVAGHNISIQHTHLPEVAVLDTNDTELTRYNPEFVIWFSVYEDSVEKKVPVITRNLLRAYSQKEAYTKGLGERFGNAILTGRHLKNIPELIDYFLFEDGQIDKPLGLRADRAQELAARLKAKTIVVSNIGTRAITFFEAYCSAMVSDDRIG